MDYDTMNAKDINKYLENKLLVAVYFSIPEVGKFF